MTSDCCSGSGEGACSLSTRNPGVCPSCGKQGKTVSVLTVKSLVLDHTRVSASSLYSFCRTPTCDVVYFGAEDVFEKKEVKVRVGVKETEDPIPLCYCFGYTRENIRHDNAGKTNSTMLEKIKAEIEGGFCACEVKNPCGTCCLGEITRAIQESRQA